MAIKTGPLSPSDLMAVWQGSVDETYSEPLLRNGDGGGLEVYSQAAEQFGRVSQAIDVTTQGMYILPWSGQTAPPAGGAQQATVQLTLTRAGLVHKPLVLKAGAFWVDEIAIDHGQDGPVQVNTGRRYFLQDDAAIAPGDVGPVLATFVAEKPGYGYNNPLPGTINGIEQAAGDFFHDRATVTPIGPFAASLGAAPAVARITTVNEADTFLPDHVGQWVLFTDGANKGALGRIVAFIAQPDPVADTGSVVDIELTHAVQCSTFSGTFQPGEQLTFGTPTAYGALEGVSLAGGVLKLVYRFLSGSVAAIGTTITGATSGATATVQQVLTTQTYTAEAPSGGIGGASWRIVSWTGADFEMSAANADCPAGGVLGMLDQLGRERDTDRAGGETDDVYRQRVATPADVVTPNAIRRALARALNAIFWSYREVGSALLPGIYFDGDETAPSATPHGARNDAFDYGTWEIKGTLTSGTFFDNERVVLEKADGTYAADGFFGAIRSGALFFIPKAGLPKAGASWRVRGKSSGAIWTTSAFQNYVDPASDPNYYRRVFDYTDFRAFFLVTVQRLAIQDFGVCFDVGPHNAFDLLPPFICAFDGFAAGNGAVYGSAYQAVDTARAGGVTFKFEQVPVSVPVGS